MRDRTSELKGKSQQTPANSTNPFLVPMPDQQQPTPAQTPPRSSSGQWESLRTQQNDDIELGIITKPDKKSKSRGSKAKTSPATPPTPQPTQYANEQDSKWMEAFFEDVSSFERGLAELNAKLPQLERLQSRILAAFQESEERRLHSDLEQITSECSQIAYSLGARLKSMESGLEQNLTPGSADHRMSNGQLVNLSRKLRNAVSKYQSVQKTYRDKQKVRFERQYRIINPSVSDEEMARVLEAQNGKFPGVASKSIFAEHILSANAMEDARRVMVEVNSRHEEIVSLSRDIVQLEQLFNELSLLVTNQDDMVNQVAYQAESSKNYMHESSEVLVSAIKSARSARRRKWCMFISCLILVAVITVVVIFVVVPKVNQMTA